jgi:uncharacterized protein with ParB-like and HNH nuclease domain
MPNVDRNDLRAREKQLNRFFILEEDQQYIVPRYQRSYKWSSDNIEDLWQDLQLEGSTTYFGTMLFNVKEPNSIQIIDGQQRLTSVTIFAALCRNILYENTDNENFNNSDKQKLKNRAKTIHHKFIQVEESGSYIIKHNLVNFKRFFKENIQKIDFGFNKTHPVLDVEGLRKESPEGNVQSNYSLLRNRIKSDSNYINAQNQGAEAIELYFKKLITRLSKFYAVEITIEDDEIAYEYFEAVNAKGVKLDVADLLKNLILKNLRIDNAEQWWTTLIENIIESSKSREDIAVQEFFRYYWASEHKYVPNKQLYKAIKKYTIENCNNDDDWEDFLLEILEYSEIYKNLLTGSLDDFPKITNENQKNSFYRSLVALRCMKAKTWTVLFLNYYKNYARFNSKGIKANTFSNLFEIFVFNYFVVLNYPGNWFFQKMHSFAGEFNTLHKNTASSDRQYKDIFNSLMMAFKEKLPLNTSFYEDYESSAITRIKYSTSPTDVAIVRYLLNKIEANLRPSGVGEYRSSSLTSDDQSIVIETLIAGGWNENLVEVEHILPRNPLENDSSVDWSHDNNELRKWNTTKIEMKPYVNMIGNLALLEMMINKDVSNFNFKVKKGDTLIESEQGDRDSIFSYKDSMFYMVRELNEGKFNFEDISDDNYEPIINRSKYLVKHYIYKLFILDFHDMRSLT